MPTTEQQLEATRAYHRRYRAEHPEKVLQYSRKFRANNLEKERARQRASTAKRRRELGVPERISSPERKRELRRIRQRRYHAENPEKFNTKNKQWREKNSEKAHAKQKEWKAKNREHVRTKAREWTRKNREKLNAKGREKWAQSPELRAARYNKQRTRLRNDPILRMLTNCRRRIHLAITDPEYLKVKSVSELFGCEKDFLIGWLEAGFKPGMTWDNYGRHGWHVDHIKPCSSFTLSDPIQLRKCFHFTNLQPLWASENMSKGAHTSLR